MHILASLCKGGQPNRYNFTLPQSLRDYSGEINVADVAEVLMAGWMWLERECLIAPTPGDTSGNCFFVTRRGLKLNESGDLTSYQNASLLSQDKLDPVLARKVSPLFIRGDYDTAVFQAFKEVEVRTRETAGLGNDLYGRDLMKAAFHPDTGILIDLDQERPERKALFLLFNGAIGLFKNPHSHRNVELDNPLEASELIGFANYLMRVIEDRKVKNE